MLCPLYPRCDLHDAHAKTSSCLLSTTAVASAFNSAPLESPAGDKRRKNDRTSWRCTKQFPEHSHLQLSIPTLPLANLPVEYRAANTTQHITLTSFQYGTSSSMVGPRQHGPCMFRDSNIPMARLTRVRVWSRTLSRKDPKTSQSSSSTVLQLDLRSSLDPFLMARPRSQRQLKRLSSPPKLFLPALATIRLLKRRSIPA